MNKSKYRSQTGISNSLFLILLLLFTFGCSRDTYEEMAALRVNPSAEDAGPFIVFGAMLAAADYLEMDFEDVASVLQSPAVLVDSSTASQGLSEGQFLLYPESTEPSVFEEVFFENTSNEKIVLFLESFGPSRESQGFSYVKLEPGSKFRYVHNVHPAVVKVGVFLKGVATGTAAKVVVGTSVIIIIGEEAKSAFRSNFACNLSTKAIQPDECVGSCTAGTGTCQGIPGSYVQYGAAWMGMAQPTACGCM